MLREQVVVPTGRHHPRAVARGERQSRVCPRHPRQFHPDLGSAAQHFRIRCCGRQLSHQRRGVPRSADHRNLLHAWLFERFAQHLTHMRLASFLVQSFIEIAHRRKFITQRDHRLGNGIKTSTIRARFDDVIPPSFRIVVPGRVGEHADGIGPYGGTRVEATRFGQVESEFIVRRLGPAPATITAVGQHHRSREVAEPDRPGIVDGPAHGLPLRRERGEGPECRDCRFGHRIREDGDRRRHLVRPDEAHKWVGIRRSFDQHDVRVDAPQLGQYPTGRTRPVVPYPEHVGARANIFGTPGVERLRWRGAGTQFGHRRQDPTSRHAR